MKEAAQNLRRRKLETLLYGSGSVLFLGLAGLSAPGYSHSTIFTTSLVAGLIVLALAFSISTWPYATALWRHRGGKLLLTGVHLFVLLVSVGVARKVVADSLRLPPQDFDFAVSCCVVLVYLPVFGALLECLSIMALAVLLVLTASEALLSDVFKWLPFGRTLDQRARHRFPKLLGAIGMTFVLLLAQGALVASHERLHPLVRWMAFLGDFQQIDRYPGVPPGARVRLHENGVVSSATIEHGTVVITVSRVSAP